jgi:hypothetical protein
MREFSVRRLNSTKYMSRLLEKATISPISEQRIHLRSSLLHRPPYGAARTEI